MSLRSRPLRALFLLLTTAFPLGVAACTNDDDGSGGEAGGAGAADLATACGQLFDAAQGMSSRCFYDVPLDRDFAPSGREAYLRWCANNFGLPGGAPEMPSRLSRCAAGVGATTCDMLAPGDDLSCPELREPSGTRKAGEPCEESLQCESGRCTTDGESRCGVCARLAGEGESCAGQGVACGAGLRCEPGAGGAGEVCQRRGVEGAACSNNGACDAKLVCDGGACKAVGALPKAGEPCAQFCAFGSLCASSVCVALPREGEACVPNDTGPECAAGLRCDDASKACKRRFAGEVEPGGVCGEDDFCKGGTCRGGRCVAYAKLGEACGDEGASPGDPGAPPPCEDDYDCRAGACVAWTPACAAAP